MVQVEDAERVGASPRQGDHDRTIVIMNMIREATRVGCTRAARVATSRRLGMRKAWRWNGCMDESRVYDMWGVAHVQVFAKKVPPAATSDSLSASETVAMNAAHAHTTCTPHRHSQRTLSDAADRTMPIEGHFPLRWTRTSEVYYHRGAHPHRGASTLGVATTPASGYCIYFKELVDGS